MPNWDQVFDVVVVGSGAAGIAAALTAQINGAQAIVIEKTDKFGGTSAVSGGVPWIPNNHHMAEIGAPDSREQALTYLRSLALGAADAALAETFVDEGPAVIRFLEDKTPLQFRALQLPDYHPEHPGGAFGRSLAPSLFAANELGDLRPHLRSAPLFPIPFTMADPEDGVDLLDPVVMGDRMAKGLVGTGMALVGGLLKGALDQGVTFKRNVRVQRLIMEDGAVIGIEGEGPDGLLRIGARRGVILASGGFEWNTQLVHDMVRGPIDGALSPPFNDGDGLIMAAEAQAALANTQEAWWMPMIQIPGDEYEGRQLNRLVVGERACPRSIIVNRQGKRFVNEAHNYSDVGRAFHNFDPVSYDYPNLPAWIIIDQGFLDKYPFGTRYPGDPIPKWLTAAQTLPELAAKIGVDPDGLAATIERYNANVARGEDPDFGRGKSQYDVYYGDPAQEGVRRTLGPLDQAPYYACRVYSGVLGTKGGPKINAKSEVLNVRGGRIAGLYAAGNVSASFTGMAYPGAGGTLGPGLVFGHIAGREAARGSNRI